MLINKLIVTNLFKNQIKFCNRLYATKSNRKLNFKNNCIITTVGSQSSGKTTLTEALKRTSAEQFNIKLEADINSGTNNSIYSKYYVDNTQITHIDGDTVPSKNLITSCYGADIGILVIDATKGLDDQAKEHIIVLNFHGIKDIIVYLNKLDQLNDEQLKELFIDEIKSFFKQQNLNLLDDSIVCGSALNVIKKQSDNDRQSIINLLKLIEIKSKNISRDEQIKKPAIFSIKRSHTKANKGTEVTGFMRQGILKKNDIVNIIGYDRSFKTKIQEIESFKEQLDFVQPGLSAALLLKSIKREDIKRGMIVIHPDKNNLEITDHFMAKLYCFKGDEQNLYKNFIIQDDTTLQLYARTFNVTTIIKMENDKKELLPGESGDAVFKLIKTMPLEKGMKFLVRTSQTVGIGEIIKILPSYEIEFLNKARRN